jgi:hypothetical protein
MSGSRARPGGHALSFRNPAWNWTDLTAPCRGILHLLDEIPEIAKKPSDFFTLAVNGPLDTAISH